MHNSLLLRLLLKSPILAGATLGTAATLHQNDDNHFNAIGVVRLYRTTSTVLKIITIYKKNLHAKTSSEYKERLSQCHKKSAEELLNLCCKNRGVYIKAGQHVAVLDYLLPREYTQTLNVLHNRAPQTSIKDVYKVIREDFQRSPAEIFQTFDTVPVGSASLAQVHRATLKDGRVVAVKVQDLFVRGNAAFDILTMEYFVALMSWLFPDFKLGWLLEETKKNIPRELDFSEEGRNAEKVTEMFRDFHWLRIPRVHWELSTERVLTMDFMEGGKVTDLEYMETHGINPYEVSDKLGQIYSRMIFINGFVHSDPHPGNIFVTKSPGGGCDIILLDHGLYANLKSEFRVEYANLWLSILNRDLSGMRSHCANLGITDNYYGLLACMVTGRTWNSIVDGIETESDQKRQQKEKELIQSQFSNILPHISQVLEKVNQQMILILKTNDFVRGIELTLKTSARMEAFKVMSQCCVKSVYGQKFLEESSKLGKIKVTLQEFWALFRIQFYYNVLNLKTLLQDVINLAF